MKPTVTAKDITLLEQHAELPSADAMLTRFGVYYDACTGGSEARYSAPQIPDLPEPLPAEDGLELSDGDQLGEEGETLALEEAEEASLAEAPELNEPEDHDQDGEADELEAVEATVESASPEVTEEGTASEMAEREEDSEEMGNDTVLGFNALTDDDIAAAQSATDAGTLMMAGISDEAIVAAREQLADAPAEEAPVEPHEASTQLNNVGLTDEAHAAAAVTENMEAPKRKGRKSRKTKKKS